MQTQVPEMLAKLGFSKLNPMQEKALAEGFLEAPRVVVSAPTASGKTLLALLKIIDNFEKTQSKAVYVVPLRALAAEKHAEFSQTLETFGMKVALSTGDLDSSSEALHEFDVIIVTSEKLDSLLRHKTRWLENVGLLVADEVHLLNDFERGATLEIVLTKLAGGNTGILALSATIPNALEIAEWLNARLITSDYRPVPLYVGVCDSAKLYFPPQTKAKEKFEDKKFFLAELAKKALAGKQGAGQALFFVSTRRGAEALGRELSAVASGFLNESEKAECAILAEKALRALGTPTSQCKALAECLKNGVAFHHAGLPATQRELIEKGFKRDRCLKIICATTTLAMGIDYPASWVVVRDLKRFNGAFAEFIPNLEAQQMLGRAGRPQFDSTGTAILCCAPHERLAVEEKYVFGPLENVFSKLSSEPVLRGHVLALIASNYANDFESLFKFFERTFYAFQYRNTAELLETVERVVAELKKMDFVREKNGFLVATPLGKRAAELYIDPLSADAFVQFIQKTQSRQHSDFDFLMLLAEATESRPFVSVSRGEERVLWEELYALADDLDLVRLESDADALEKFKTSKVLNAWINEETEAKMMEQFGLPPGVVHSRARNSEWLAYAVQELAFMLNASTAFKQAKALRKRIKNGIKEELLDLCKLRGIGRLRARRLFDAGIRSAEEFQTRGKEEIKKIFRGD